MVNANILHTKQMLYYWACAFSGLGRHASYDLCKLQLQTFFKDTSCAQPWGFHVWHVQLDHTLTTEGMQL